MSEIDKAKVAVLQNALGICALSEPELYERLEKIYWLGFKAGSEFVKEPQKQITRPESKSGCNMPGCEIVCQGGPDFDNDPTAE